MKTYPAGTVGWLKYGGSNTWLKVDVLGRYDGTHIYGVRRSRTTFTVSNADVLIVVGGG